MPLRMVSSFIIIYRNPHSLLPLTQPLTCSIVLLQNFTLNKLELCGFLSFIK